MSMTELQSASSMETLSMATFPESNSCEYLSDDKDLDLSEQLQISPTIGRQHSVTGGTTNRSISSSSTGCYSDFDTPLEPSSVLLSLLVESCNTEKNGDAGPYSNASQKIQSIFDNNYEELTRLSYENKQCMVRIERELFSLKGQKNYILRRESELLYTLQETILQDEYGRLKDEVHFLQTIPSQDKCQEDQEKEDMMVAKMIGIVEQRNNMLLDIDIERLRESEEDNELIAEQRKKEKEWSKLLYKETGMKQNFHTEIELNGERPMAALKRQLSINSTYLTNNRFRLRKDPSEECTII